jgi:hypothetical protein
LKISYLGVEHQPVASDNPATSVCGLAYEASPVIIEFTNRYHHVHLT